MTQMICPFCGPRELDEFQFHKTLAANGIGPVAAVFERVARLDRSLEHWQHIGGCRTWMLLERNPSTGDILQILKPDAAIS